MPHAANPLGAASPLLAVDNFFSQIIHPDHVVFAEDAAGGGEPVGFEAFRVANGRRSPRDYATAENANEEWRLVVQMDSSRIANFVAIDRGHNLEGVTVAVEGDDDPNFSSATTLVSATIPSTVTVPTDLRISPGAKTPEGAWLFFFDGEGSFDNYRIVVPALGAGLKPKIVGAFLGFAWEPEHASILPYAPSGPEVVFRETVSDALWAGSSKPVIRRTGSIRISAATENDRANARRYVERMIWTYQPVWWIPYPDRGEGSWLGRVSSGRYAFTRTAQWPLGEATFELNESEPDTRTSFTLPTFVEETEEEELVYSIARSTDGLAFRDRFNRADANALGNGWTEVESAATDLRIVGQQVAGAAVTNEIAGVRPADEIGAAAPTMVQANVRARGSSIIMLASRFDGSLPETDAYRFFADYRTGQEDWILARAASGSFSTLCTSTVSPPLVNQWRGLRGVVNGDNVKLLSTPTLVNGQVLTTDFVVRCDETDPSPIETFNRTMFRRLSLATGQLSDFDEFFVCGVEITVTGIPTGWKIRIDSRPAAVESGGSVTIDVTTWALPATTIRLFDVDDVEQATLSPASGIWGGDVYAVTSS